MGEVVLIFAPLEAGKPTKTGGYDQTTILDDTRMPDLGELMHLLANERLVEEGLEDDDDHPEVGLWPFTPGELSKEFAEAVKELKLDFCIDTMYQNRHGGASRDQQMKLRTLADTQKRGKWLTKIGPRIYDKSGRVQGLVNRAPPEIIEYGEDVRKNFLLYYLNGAFPVPPRVTMMKPKPKGGTMSSSSGSATLKIVPKVMKK